MDTDTSTDSAVQSAFDASQGFGDETFMPVARDSDSISMLRGLSAREQHSREDTVAQCRSMFQVWFWGLGSPPANWEVAKFLDGAGSGGGDPSQRWRIEEQLPELLRLSRAAPLPDVREKAAGLLRFVEESLQMRLPRSRHASGGSHAAPAASDFIPQSDLIPIDDCCQEEAATTTTNSTSATAVAAAASADSHDLDPELIRQSQSLLLEQFHEWHRVGNVFQVMAYHPAYLDVFLQFHNSLLQGSGPVGTAERHYLAIMAAARHRNSYLVHVHSVEYLHQNGDPAWLKGIEHAAPKIRKLGHLCRLLAHRPWELTSDSLRSLLTGPDSLSQSELIHSLCILAHFVALAGFVGGTGVRPEIDSPLGHTYRTESGESLGQGQQQQQQQQQPQPATLHNHNYHLGLNGSGGGGSGGAPSSPAPSSPGVDPKQTILELMNAMKNLSTESQSADQLPEEQLIQRFECVEQETADIRCFFRSVSRDQQQQQQHQQSQRHQQHQSQQHCQDLVNSDLAGFCQDPAYEYKDFHLAKSDSKQLRIFRVQDYSWEQDGSCLVDRYLPSLNCELDARFQTSFDLTYGTMGSNRNVETTPFRRALWYYVLSIFGIRHDDYDYSLINRMLSIELKKYCKLVACWPDQVNCGHYKTAMPGFKHSEKVHVNLVIMDARLQAILLYGLKALNNHMTGQ